MSLQAGAIRDEVHRMRRLTSALLLGLVLAVSSVSTAGAAKPTSNSAIQGTYTYRDAGFSITVGYVCPGYTSVWGSDPYANYAATVTKGGWATATMMRHAPWKLDLSLYEFYGVHLSEKASQVLAYDAATIRCA
jgi:hypothetical protein